MPSSITAILLAAGVGKRMGPDADPKCLLQVGGRTLLRRMLEDLRSAGVLEVVLVVGFRKEQVAAEARRFSGELRLQVIENDRYREGAVLSLWSARAFLDRPVLVMDADVLCPPSAVARLVGSPYPGAILVDGSSVESGEEQMVFGDQGRVFHIAKRPGEEIRRRWRLLGESVGFLKLSGDGAVQLRRMLEENLNSGAVTLEHEQLYPRLFEKIFVGCERVDGMAWTEIDTPEDLERARSEIFPRWSFPKCLNRRFSDLFFPWVSRLPLGPNHWTAIGFLLGLLALVCWADGGYRMGLLGAVLFQLFYLTDNWDGDLARLRGVSSRLGAWFDLWVDALVQTALPVALAAGLMARGVEPWVSALGWVAAAGMALDFLITFWARIRGFGPAVFSDRAERSGGAPSRWIRWIRVNGTNENFSLVMAGVLLADGRLPFLIAAAVGSHLYWTQFLWNERHRLIQWAS